jgi:DNA replication protein DnaC
MNKLIQNWLKTRTKEKPGLYLFGTTGTGKTHNLKILHEKNKLKNNQAKFYTVPEILNRIAGLRMEMSHDKYQFGINTAILNKILAGGQILILDDFGTETLSERKMEDLYTIINNMYEKGTTLIISSNLSIQELERKVGDRICSRLVGMCHIVELTGNDKRFK